MPHLLNILIPDNIQPEQLVQIKQLLQPPVQGKQGQPQPPQIFGQVSPTNQQRPISRGMFIPGIGADFDRQFVQTGVTPEQLGGGSLFPQGIPNQRTQEAPPATPEFGQDIFIDPSLRLSPILQFGTPMAPKQRKVAGQRNVVQEQSLSPGVRSPIPGAEKSEGQPSRKRRSIEPGQFNALQGQ